MHCVENMQKWRVQLECARNEESSTKRKNAKRIFTLPSDGGKERLRMCADVYIYTCCILHTYALMKRTIIYYNNTDLFIGVYHLCKDYSESNKHISLFYQSKDENENVYIINEKAFNHQIWKFHQINNTIQNLIRQ